MVSNSTIVDNLQLVIYPILLNLATVNAKRSSVDFAHIIGNTKFDLDAVAGHRQHRDSWRNVWVI